MSPDSALLISVGLNFVQLGILLREKRLRQDEKERFAQYIKATDKRLDRVEKKSRHLR